MKTKIGYAAALWLLVVMMWGGCTQAVATCNEGLPMADSTSQGGPMNPILTRFEGCVPMAQVKLLTWSANGEDCSEYILSRDFYAYLYVDTKERKMGLCFWDEQQELDIYGYLLSTEGGEAVQWNTESEMEQFEMHLLWDNSEEFPPAKCSIYVTQLRGYYCYRFVLQGQMGTNIFEGVEVKSAIDGLY